MDKTELSQNALIFKALSDEKRLAVLLLLQEGEKCACALTDSTNIAQSALSYHMKILKDSGIVVCRNDGKYCHYSLSAEGSNRAIELLKNITNLKIPNQSGSIQTDCACS